VKERNMSVFVEKEVNRKDVYEIKRSYRQNKSNSWLSQIISQVRCVNEKDYHKFYLVVYKTDKDHEEIKEEIFEMPRHGNAENPNAPLYYRQDPVLKSVIEDKLKLGHSTEKIYISLINDQEESTLSENDSKP